MNTSTRLGIAGLLTLAGCFGRVDGEPRSTDATSPPSSPPSSPPGSTPGSTGGTTTKPTVPLAGATELRFERESLGGALPKGAACQELHLSVGVVRATRTATWSSCRSGALVGGTRTLTEDEESRFEAHVQAAVYEEFDRTKCSYDGTLYGMNVVTSTGIQLYVDGNLNCYTDRRIAPEVLNLTRELWEVATGAPMP